MESIHIKSPKEIECMRAAGKLAAGARTVAREGIRAGVTTREIDREVRSFLRNAGAVPTFYRYGGFPGNACISVNEELIHGIPSDRLIHPGDIVSVNS